MSYSVYMPLFWSDEYKLNIKIIDEQHKQFVAALGELIDAVGNVPMDKVVVDRVFEKVTSYSIGHFKTEERYFLEFKYEGAQEHIAEHEKFKQKLADLKERYLTHTMEASFDLADYLEDWLINHLAKMDKKYVECFHQHNLY
jgi:hemerythrin